MFPNITYWALKLIRPTEDGHPMFFDPRFLSYSALKWYSDSGQLAYETRATNLHTISMLQKKVLQIKLYSSFIFLNEAVDLQNGKKRVTLFLPSCFECSFLAATAQINKPVWHWTTVHVILARHLGVQGPFRKVLLVGQATITLVMMTLSSLRTVEEIWEPTFPALVFSAKKLKVQVLVSGFFFFFYLQQCRSWNVDSLSKSLSKKELSITTIPTPIPPDDKRQLWLLFTFLNRFSRCSCKFLSISEKIGILPALVCLVMATKTNFLLAQAGEGRNYLITSTCGWGPYFAYSFSNFRFHVIMFFTELKKTGRSSEKTV